MCVVLLHTLTSDWHGCGHAHPSCCPPGFSAHPSSKYTRLEKPFEETPPSPTPHTKNIQPRPPLHPPHPLSSRLLAFLSVCLPCPAAVYVLLRCKATPLFSLPFAPSLPLLAPPRFQLGISADAGKRPSCLQGSQSPPPAKPADHPDGQAARSGLWWTSVSGPASRAP